jgi:hypothetical protein
VPEYHLWFQLISPRNGIALTDHLCISRFSGSRFAGHFFELPKFQRPLKELTTPLPACRACLPLAQAGGGAGREGWLYFLRYAEDLNPESLPEPLDTSEIRQAMEVSDLSERGVNDVGAS